MNERGFKSKKRYLLAFIIGTILFILIFLISNTISFLEFQRVSNIQDNLAYKIFEDKLVFSFFNKSSCVNELLNQISENLRFQGQIIDDLEEKFGKNDERVLQRKKFYTLVELEHFELIQERIKNCGLSINIILFFYSNLDEDIDRSEEIGRILTDVYLQNEERLFIYSFDVNLDSNLIKNLIEKYGIEDSPTLIINCNSKITEPIRVDNIKNYLV